MSRSQKRRQQRETGGIQPSGLKEAGADVDDFRIIGLRGAK
ncbi:MAG: hypothetical protein QGH94_04560 [Phycisphaerae bacterium]|nr:hypothetical protein [Phycisphaerae bacterium]MDP7287247.1 hypothetical protein [Phycisphaerae bacterium]